MAKKVYTGISDIARNIKAMYVGVNGVARNITKGYVGVNGIARQFWETKPYTELEYIGSTGTQYINTGFKHNQNTRFVADMELENANRAWVYPFGSFGSTNYNSLFCVEIYTDFKLTTYYGSTTRHEFGITANGRHTFDLNKNVHKIDNTTYTYSSRTFQSSHNDLIFGTTRYDGAVEVAKTPIKLYSFKIYDNGALIRDFIPVLDNNNVPCLYDKVSEAFFYNQGTGVFSYGTLSTTSLNTTILMNTGSLVGLGDKAEVTDETLEKVKLNEVTEVKEAEAKTEEIEKEGSGDER